MYARMATASEVVMSLARGTVVKLEFVLTGGEIEWCRILIPGSPDRVGYVRCMDLEREPPPRWKEMSSQRVVEYPGAAPSERVVLRAPTTVPIHVVDNVTLVQATLNGSQRAVMMVDTGASATIITPVVLTRLGLSIPDDAPRRQLQVVGGQLLEIPFVRLAAIEVGNARIEGLEVGVYEIAPQAPVLDGLLGGDFLHHFRVTLDKTVRELRFDAVRGQ